MSIAPSRIRQIEAELVSRGYAQRHWRRGAMGTRVYAKGSERVVIMRNTGADRDAPGDASVEEWFERLEALLEDLRKGARISELYLCGERPVELPERFLRWCKSMGVQLHAGDDDAAAPASVEE
ncbi:MAG TPA: hypothetical protein VHE37_11425 [Nevskiaceae bacterium]|nr:hypothetical protein [Nevskiaceae bacterium]